MEDCNKQRKPAHLENNPNKQNSPQTALSNTVLATEIKEYSKVSVPKSLINTTNQNMVPNTVSSIVRTSEKQNCNEILLSGSTYPNARTSSAVSNTVSSMVRTAEMSDCNKIIVPTATFRDVIKENIGTNVLSNLVLSNKLNKENLSLIPIKSILKKEMNSKFNSNPDLSGITLRDSVEVTRNKSARIRRSNSFSQGINYIANKPKSDERNNYIDDESARKIVRFADDPQANKKENIFTINAGFEDTYSDQKIPGIVGIIVFIINIL